MSNTFKTVSIDTMIDKHIGKRGTDRREAFENELRIDLLGQAIKQARQERNLTQEQLGELVGVQKAQISKIENSVKNARFETILKVFDALGAKVNFNVELNDKKLQVVDIVVGFDAAEGVDKKGRHANFGEKIMVAVAGLAALAYLA